MPWVPLANYTGNPEPLLRQYRKVIDERAPEKEVPNLLAVCQVVANLVVSDVRLIHRIFGETPMIMETPIMQEVVALAGAKQMHRAIGRVLQSRFGQIPEVLRSKLETVMEAAKLDTLIDWATTCPDLEAFRDRLVEASK
jgi:hypothetical protein